MVSLIEHGDEASTPLTTSWLRAGSVALGLVALIAQTSTLRVFRADPQLFRPIVASMLAAAAIVVYGWWAPLPWLLALMTVVTLTALWLFAISRWYRSKTFRETSL